jgi:hypothetical protein
MKPRKAMVRPVTCVPAGAATSAGLVRGTGCPSGGAVPEGFDALRPGGGRPQTARLDIVAPRRGATNLNAGLDGVSPHRKSEVRRSKAGNQ